MWLLLLFILVPLIEIGLFIQVGGWIGLWPTLGIVLVTAFLGTYLVRAQGILAINQLKQSFNDLRDPTEPLAHGAMILIAGALLLTPGFFTDAIGFSLLIPPVRGAAFRYLRSRIRVTQFSYGDGPQPSRPNDPTIIDADYTEVDPSRRPTHGPSGWTRH